MSDDGARRRAEQSEPRRELLASVGKPMRDFLHTETGSAGLLVLMTAIALLWANSPWSDSYVSLWHTDISINVGSRELSMSLVHWVNDGLMVIFFFIIGLELRHEISVGDLRQKSSLVIPVLGAIGGLVLPAILYVIINPSGDEIMGWGVVIGTDTAFLLGALALVGPKASSQLRVFLLSMTIADDLMAVAIIGIVYSDSINLIAVGVAIASLVAIALLGRAGAWQILAYVVAGFVAWFATLESGLHPSIIGMLAGILVVSHPPRRDAIDAAARMFSAFRQAPVPSASASVKQSLQRATSVNERFQQILHPWTSFFIVPVFALANAGVDLRDGVLADSLQSPVVWGIVVGLVIGKPVGISVMALLAHRIGWGKLPRGLGPGQVIGGGALSGMGFSVSILIVNLAFDSPDLQREATVGVLMACALSVVTAWLAFQGARVFLGEEPMELPNGLDAPIDEATDHILGPSTAEITLVEYADFECPFCGAATTVVTELRQRYGDRLRYVFRHMPLADVHPHAELAAEAAEAAAAQGKFWEMHAQMFRQQDQLEIEDLVGYAGAIGLDVEEFTRSLTEGRYSQRVRVDAASADASGARGTPTFFINGVRHHGPWDAQNLINAIEHQRDPDSAPAPGRGHH